MFPLLLLLLHAGFTAPVAWGQMITIKGSFRTPPEPGPVTFYRPVNGFFNVFYAADADEAMISNGQFTIQSPHDTAGFFRIQSKGIPKTYFYGEPNDTIVIEFVEDRETGETRAVYGGSHAPANNLLARKKLLNEGKATETLLAAILKNARTAEEAIAGIERELEPRLAALRQLHQSGAISKSCLDAFTAEVQQNALNWSGSLLAGYAAGSREAEQTIRMDKAELARLTALLYERYDPFSAENRVATTNYANCHAKSILMMDQVIGGPRPRLRTWSRFDEAFGAVVRRVAAIDFAPAAVQEYFIGKSLLTALAFNTIGRDDFKQMVKVYTEAFPGSAYLPILHRHLPERSGPATAGRPVEYNLYLKEAARIALSERKPAGIDTVTTIQSLVKHYFPGKSVFIDFWATWCAPCIAEFKHEAALHQFLESKNIVVLYVSIDKAPSKPVWEKMINKYAITGYHYLASPAVYEHLNGWFQGIPRYMLFGADGVVLHDNLPRPSRQAELFRQINALTDGDPGISEKQ